ncbi:DegT/DnrJ/EryC1/StrS family aminotransferase [Solwaraspora sp. WMMD1047]|uniref:DegT/DnrJ/EryC1/StrS family aminotransferase n=1 Tax=Solwaraspora sp. WMMD1047 TaxID=3016102 RepID=UPI002415EF23|nr:DegT/DnrJ/EryC1/StrS family aminotransferase [Solwaraspora sp. WMMD1047]MDG4827778.1 DegT/DnrJ/EryC1/StrS family aminotransferase [Solwaraspora sp. WMMD1047]
MRVPFLDLRAAYLELQGEIDAAVARVLASGWYLAGPEIEAFEAEFASYCDNRHCVAVASGSDALELTLRALDIGPGDEVIVPSHTFIATWTAVSATGARPVPVEPDEVTYLIDPARIEAAVTGRTRAIMPVHLYGQPVDLEAVVAVADRHGLAVVEDAAQAHGSRYRGRRIGSGTTATAFSFYPGKNLGALGDGGAVVTADPELADRLRLLRSYGSRVKYRHEIRATNHRLDELQAAVLRVKLARLDEWNDRRRQVADRYLTELTGFADLTLPTVAAWSDPVWHLFVLRTPDRQQLQERLSAAGVDTLIHYPVAPHRTPAYADTPLAAGAYPIAERLADQVLSLPMGPHLSAEAVTAVVRAVGASAGLAAAR